VYKSDLKPLFHFILAALFMLIGSQSYAKSNGCGKRSLIKFRSKWPSIEEEVNFYDCFYEKGIPSISLPGFIKVALRSKDPSLQDELIGKALEDVPRKYEVFLFKSLINKKMLLSPKVSSDLMYFFALRMFDQKNIKSSLKYLSKQVGIDFPRYGQSLFLKAVIMTKLGKLNEAESIFSQLATGNFKTNNKETKSNLISMSKLNLSRIKIELGDYKSAVDQYRDISFRDNLWFDGLVEMSWTMISKGDYEGAIGNASFIEKSTSSFIYKPWPSAIESIGLLKICQYPNAKKTVERFSSQYKDTGDVTLKHLKKNSDKSWYQYAAEVLDTKLSKSNSKKTPPLLFYAARSNAVIGQQKLLNELFDEEEKLLKMKKKFRRSKQSYVFKLVSKRLNTIGRNIKSAQKKMGYTFRDKIKSLLKEYYNLQKIVDVVGFEIFARSSDSITMRVAGKKFIDEMKKAGNKSASWNFNGEFWADEAGRFRSLLENKCAKLE